MFLSLAVLVAGAAGADDKDAKALFTKMEAVILKAKTFRTDVALLATAGKEEMMEGKGRLLVADGNRVRMEFDGKLMGKAEKIAFVSDGKKMRTADPKSPSKDQDAEKQLTEIVLASASRTGLFLPLFFVSASSDGKKEAFAIDTELPVSDFKLGKKELVGTVGAEAQAVEYVVKPKGSKEPVAATVWIDTKTNLPVKRILVVKEGKETITITETYTKSAVDVKFDEKEFALPK